MTYAYRSLMLTLALSLAAACGTTEIRYIDRAVDTDGGAVGDDGGAAGIDSGDAPDASASADATADAPPPDDAGTEPTDLGMDAGVPVGGCAAFMPYTWTVEWRPNAALSSGVCDPRPTTRTEFAMSRAELFPVCPSVCTCETFSEPCSVRRTLVCREGTGEEIYIFSASATSFSGTFSGWRGGNVCVSDVVGTWVSP